MKSAKILSALILLLLLLSGVAFSNDTDLYTASGEGVEPNILIIFDNSGSMNEEVQYYFYDPTITYTPQTYSPNAVYYWGGWWTGWVYWKSSISEVPCPTAQTALTNNGHYEGRTNSSCNGDNRSLRTGNYRNYLASIGGDETKPKLWIAKQVIKDFLDTVQGVRVGVMIFDYEEGGFLHSEIRSLDYEPPATNPRTALKDEIDDIAAHTWTPLAETLYEAGLYFKGGRSYFNSSPFKSGSVNYTSPIQYHCQMNYVILITDGESTHDRNSVLRYGDTVGGTTYPAIGDQDGDGREPNPNYPSEGSDYLDDVAKYLYDNDLRTNLTGKQNIITYTIGFTINNSLLNRTATHGHGRYFYSQNSQQLSDAFQNIVGEILAKSTSFVAPIVPVSRLERTTAGDKIYLAFFKPFANGMWKGNIKKFGLNTPEDPHDCSYDPSLPIGALLDANCSPALDSNGQFYSTATSYWTSTPLDGGEVDRGGVGEVLLSRTSARSLYTYFNTNMNLSHSSNSFATTNTSITPAILGVANDTEKNKVIRFVHGEDPYDDNGNGNLTEKRDWILGSFLHSRPTIIHYGTTRSVIFVGSNSGMLHAFDDSDGRELWGFIPPNVLNKLHALHADVIENYVDGSPRPYLAYGADGSLTRAILIFGERRGGNCYYALDVTNPDSPQFLWEISPSGRVYQTTTYTNTNYQELGQTWSTPNIAKIASADGDKWVAFISGGYDTNQDNNPVVAADSIGRAVYVIDVLDGSLVKRFSHTEISSMTYSIPSDVARVDTNGNGKVDRLYVGDAGGRIWRFGPQCDLSAPGCESIVNWTGKIVFNSNPGGTENRKIFYPPDVTLENDDGNYEMLFFGTGDREDPKDAVVENRLYGVKDKNPGTPLTENNLYDATYDELQDPGTTAEEKTTILQQLKTGNGWYIRLIRLPQDEDQNPGEKSLAPPVVFYKTVFFTTFTPTGEGVSGDPCYVGEGTARIYILAYKTGNAAFNLDGSNDTEEPVVSRTDRSKVIGTAIPSGVIITFIQGQAVAYVGVGGGVVQGIPANADDWDPDDQGFPIPSGKSLVPAYWRTIF